MNNSSSYHRILWLNSLAVAWMTGRYDDAASDNKATVCFAGFLRQYTIENT